MSTVPPGPPTPGSTGPSVIPPSQAKDPILVLVVALFLGGVAYLMIGQTQKAIAGIAVWLGALLLTIVTCGFGIVVWIPVSVAIAVDAYLQAKCLKDGYPIGPWTFFSNHL